MKGIYCFTNKINGKKYIGQSISLESRYASHKRNYKNKNLSTYNSHFYRALRKYGFNNFAYEILAQSNDYTKEKLNELEIYYIKYFDSFHNGYNMNYGGQYTSNINKKLTEQQVLEIKELIANSNISFRDISLRYGLEESAALISMINVGKVWSMVGQYDYPIRKDTFFRNRGGLNNKAKFTDQEVMDIRKRYVSETMPQIYKDYQDFCSFSELKKIIYGCQFKHLPCYKKRQGKWVNLSS